MQTTSFTAPGVVSSLARNGATTRVIKSRCRAGWACKGEQRDTTWLIAPGINRAQWLSLCRRETVNAVGGLFVGELVVVLDFLLEAVELAFQIGDRSLLGGVGVEIVQFIG